MTTDNKIYELDHLRDDIAEIKVSVQELSKTIARISVFEERLSQITSTQEGLRRQIEMLDERQRKLENEHIYAKASAKTIAMSAKVIWALAGGLIVSIFTKVLQAFL